MIERYYKDLTIIPPSADAVCVTTNGMTKNNGDAVMGAGIARSFAEKYPSLPKTLGEKLRTEGNHVHDIATITNAYREQHIVSFPTKHHWKNDSDIALIKQSAEELKALADKNNWTCIYLPRPGFGCGRLSWLYVKPVIANILDDRFIVTWR